MAGMMKTATRLLLVPALILQTLACGTIMHPERKGQRDGSIDPGIAILDGIGLLFFIIPGVIAFAVDFSNGTIYYPPGHHRRASIERFDPRRGLAGVEALLARRTGRFVRLDGPGVEAYRLD